MLATPTRLPRPGISTLDTLSPGDYKLLVGSAPVPRPPIAPGALAIIAATVGVIASFLSPTFSPPAPTASPLAFVLPPNISGSWYVEGVSTSFNAGIKNHLAGPYTKILDYKTNIWRNKDPRNPSQLQIDEVVRASYSTGSRNSAFAFNWEFLTPDRGWVPIAVDRSREFASIRMTRFWFFGDTSKDVYLPAPTPITTTPTFVPPSAFVPSAPTPSEAPPEVKPDEKPKAPPLIPPPIVPTPFTPISPEDDPKKPLPPLRVPSTPSEIPDKASPSRTPSPPWTVPVPFTPTVPVITPDKVDPAPTSPPSTIPSPFPVPIPSPVPTVYPPLPVPTDSPTLPTVPTAPPPTLAPTPTDKDRITPAPTPKPIASPGRGIPGLPSDPCVSADPCASSIRLRLDDLFDLLERLPTDPDTDPVDPGTDPAVPEELLELLEEIKKLILTILENMKLDRWLLISIFGALVHNAFWLSRDIIFTLGKSIEGSFALFDGVFKNELDEAAELRDDFGENLTLVFDSLLENQASEPETLEWKSRNRTIAAMATLYSLLLKVFAPITIGLERVHTIVAWVSNRLIGSGVLDKTETEFWGEEIEFKGRILATFLDPTPLTTEEAESFTPFNLLSQPPESLGAIASALEDDLNAIQEAITLEDTIASNEASGDESSSTVPEILATDLYPP